MEQLKRGRGKLKHGESCLLGQAFRWLAYDEPITEYVDHLYWDESFLDNDKFLPKHLFIQADRLLFLALRNGDLPAKGLFVSAPQAHKGKDPNYDDCYARYEVINDKISKINPLLFRPENTRPEESSVSISFGNDPIGDFIMVSVDTAKLYEIFCEDSLANSNTLNKTKSGRPPVFDWDTFHHEIVRIANTPDGLPDTQAELERSMAEWCQKTWKTEPSESQLRSKISPIYQSIRRADN